MRSATSPAKHKGNAARRAILCSLAAALMAATALPIVSPAQQAQPQKEDPKSNIKPAASQPPSPIRIGSVTFSGSLRVRVENWGWFETPAADDGYTFAAPVLRLSLGRQTEKLDWQVEGEFPALINLPDDAIAPPPQGQLGLGASYFAANGRQDASAVLKQAFVRFKALGAGKSSSLRLGRFEFSDGAETTPADATLATLKRDHIAQRLLGPFGFSHVGRSFDGVQYTRATKQSNFTFVAARPTEGVFQLRSFYELDVDFYYGAFTKPFPGKAAQSEARVFGLHYHDGRRALKTDNRPQSARLADTDNIRLTTLGGHFISAIKAGSGTVDVLVWGAGQFGDWGRLDQRAGAIAVEVGYQPGGGAAAKIKPWLRFGYFRSSGDGDPNDDDQTTFFQVLPTPRIYARFPFYNLMNNEDLFAQVRLKPHSRLSLRADVRHLRLSNEKDLWYVGGGAFQKNTFGYVGRPAAGNKTLGTLFDFSVDYGVSPRTAISFYAAGVRGGSVQAAIYPAGGRHPAGRYLYVEVTQRL